MVATSSGPADALHDGITNPFLTPAYAAARRSQGDVALDVALSGGAPAAAFRTGGRFSGRIEIPSLPVLLDPQADGRALRDLCRAHGASHLFVGTFASLPTPLPDVGPAIERIERSEFVIDLDGDDDLLMRFGRTHRQRVRQGQKAGLAVRRTRDPAALEDHARLIGLSMTRRSSRGEDVPSGLLLAPLLAYLQAGAGELFQAVDGGTVVASMLLLTAPRGAYDQSSGSAPEGMRVGAMHFLIAESARLLREEGHLALNLGGARPHEEGLRSFKAAFGCRVVDLEAATWNTASPVRRSVMRVAAVIRRSLVRRAAAGTDG